LSRISGRIDAQEMLLQIASEGKATGRSRTITRKVDVPVAAATGIAARFTAVRETDRRSGCCRLFDASRLFAVSEFGIGIRKDSYLRGFTYRFIELYTPHCPRDRVRMPWCTRLRALPAVFPEASWQTPVSTNYRCDVMALAVRLLPERPRRASCGSPASVRTPSQRPPSAASCR